VLDVEAAWERLVTRLARCRQEGHAHHKRDRH
jgi:hypothetical protein